MCIHFISIKICIICLTVGIVHPQHLWYKGEKVAKLAQLKIKKEFSSHDGEGTVTVNMQNWPPAAMVPSLLVRFLHSGLVWRVCEGLAVCSVKEHPHSLYDDLPGQVIRSSVLLLWESNNSYLDDNCVTYNFDGHFVRFRTWSEELLCHGFSLCHIGCRQNGLPTILVDHHGRTRVDVGSIQDSLAKLFYVPWSDGLRVR